MNVVKGLCIGLLFFGANIHGMQKKVVNNKDIIASAAVITQHALENKEAGFAILGKLSSPYFVFKGFEKIVNSDYAFAKRINAMLFGGDIDNNEEYQSLKNGTYYTTLFWVLKPLIIKAGASEAFYNKVLKIWVTTFLLGKIAAFTYNCWNNPTETKPIAPLKNDASLEEVRWHIVIVEQSNKNLLNKIREMGIEDLKLDLKSKVDSYDLKSEDIKVLKKADIQLIGLNNEFREIVAQNISVFKAGKRLSSVTTSRFIGAGLLTNLLWDVLVENRVKCVD